MLNQERYLVIIPAYNEEATIREVVNRAQVYADVCVIDDCSQDRTGEILDSIENIHVIRHEKNTHIPGVVLDGMRYAVDKDYDYAITMDAGLSHDPDELSRFISNPPTDLIIGTRITKKGTPLFRRVLSKMANLAYNCALDFPANTIKPIQYNDLTSGYRRYSNRAMRLIISRKIESKSFDILFETTMFIYNNGLTISEVPVSYTFSNSSLNRRVVQDCIMMCMKSVINPRK